MACLTDRSPLLSSAEQGRRTERCSLPNCEDVRLTTTQYTSRRNKGTLLIPDTSHPNPVPLSHNPTPVPEKVPHQSRRRREDTLDSAQCSTEVCVRSVTVICAFGSVQCSPTRSPTRSVRANSVRLFSQTIQSDSDNTFKVASKTAACPIAQSSIVHALLPQLQRLCTLRTCHSTRMRALGREEQLLSWPYIDTRKREREREKGFGISEVS